MCDIITEWNKTRSKAKRFAILNRADCPRELILRALKLYDPQEVLDLDAIWLKIDFFGDAFLQLVGELRSGVVDKLYKLDTSKFNFKERTLLLYIFALYSNNLDDVFAAFCNIDNKDYLTRIIQKRLHIFETSKTTDSLRANLYAHNKRVKVLTPAQVQDLFNTHGGTIRGLRSRINEYVRTTVLDKDASIETKVEYLKVALNANLGTPNTDKYLLVMVLKKALNELKADQAYRNAIIDGCALTDIYPLLDPDYKSCVI
jgi:hypothetical protein